MRRMRGLILVVALVFAACGGDDPTEPIHGNDTIDHGDQITPDGDDAKDDAEDVSGRTDNVTPGDDTSGPGDTGDDNGGGPSSDDGNGDSEQPPDTVEPNQCKKEGDPCEDGNPCTFGERCDADLMCVGGEVYTCEDDGRPCTDDLCDGKGHCLHVLQEGKCLINGICYDEMTASPHDACQICQPAKDKAQWTRGSNGVPCDPSSVIETCQESPGGTCERGVCVPDLLIDRNCDDGNPCSIDSCDDEIGCVSVPVHGGDCYLDDPCKVGTCNQGTCIIPPDASCDDGNPCTEDVCDPVKGCQHTELNDIACDDGDKCTVLGVCINGECVSEPRNCDDGNVCTIDSCSSAWGCYVTLVESNCCSGGVSICDDNNVCTNDDCDEDENCIHTFNTAACDDGDPCTDNDTCDLGECIGVQKNCNDGNACTYDYCENGKCKHTPLDGTPCDDGLDCSTGDTCRAGQCIPDDISGCLCQPTFYNPVSKLVTLKIEQNGQTGNALNLDGKPGCAPVEDCCCGLDNAMGPLAGIPAAADGIAKAMNEGKIILMFDHRELKTNGQPYTLAFYAGKLAPDNPGCDFKTKNCNYIVDRRVMDDSCNPLIALDNATINGNKLVAGGLDYQFPFSLPLMDGVNLDIVLYMARVEADVTISGGRIAAMTGILGGAVPKQAIMDAVRSIPDSEWPPEIGMDKNTVIGLLEMLVTPDIDGDGDGVPESASIAIKFTAIQGTITDTYQ